MAIEECKQKIDVIESQLEREQGQGVRLAETNRRIYAYKEGLDEKALVLDRAGDTLRKQYKLIQEAMSTIHRPVSTSTAHPLTSLSTQAVPQSGSLSTSAQESPPQDPMAAFSQAIDDTLKAISQTVDFTLGIEHAILG